MTKFLLPIVLLLFVACTALSREDEERLAELAATATQRQLTVDEAEELLNIQNKAKEGSLDWQRIFELIGTGLGTWFVVNKQRDAKRAKRGEAV